MSSTESGVRTSVVRAQQSTAAVASHHDQEAGDFGSAKPGPRREFVRFPSVLQTLSK